MLEPDRVALSPGGVALPTAGIPHEELPTLASSAARGQPPIIGAPGYTRDCPVMSLLSLTHFLRAKQEKSGTSVLFEEI